MLRGVTSEDLLRVVQKLKPVECSRFYRSSREMKLFCDANARRINIETNKSVVLNGNNEQETVYVDVGVYPTSERRTRLIEIQKFWAEQVIRRVCQGSLQFYKFQRVSLLGQFGSQEAGEFLEVLLMLSAKTLEIAARMDRIPLIPSKYKKICFNHIQSTDLNQIVEIAPCHPHVDFLLGANFPIDRIIPFFCDQLQKLLSQETRTKQICIVKYGEADPSPHFLEFLQSRNDVIVVQLAPSLIFNLIPVTTSSSFIVVEWDHFTESGNTAVGFELIETRQAFERYCMRELNFFSKSHGEAHTAEVVNSICNRFFPN